MTTVAEHIERNQSPYAVAKAVVDLAGMLPSQLAAAHLVVSAEAIADAACVRLDQIIAGTAAGAAVIAERKLLDAEESLADAVEQFVRVCGRMTVEMPNA